MLIFAVVMVLFVVACAGITVNGDRAARRYLEEQAQQERKQELERWYRHYRVNSPTGQRVAVRYRYESRRTE